MQEETTSTSISQQESSSKETSESKGYSTLTSNETIIAALTAEGFDAPTGLEVMILKISKRRS